MDLCFATATTSKRPLLAEGFVLAASLLPIKSDKNNLAPRIALAWRPLGANTVLRGGFGIYYDVVPTQLSTKGVPYIITEPRGTMRYPYSVQHAVHG